MKTKAAACIGNFRERALIMSVFFFYLNVLPAVAQNDVTAKVAFQPML